MAVNTGMAEPVPISGDARQAAHQAREARGRQRMIMLVVLAAAARVVADRRTQAGVIVLAIGLVAAKRMAQERGTPGLDWYRARGQDKSSSST
jgi:hypothetical protein